MFGPNQVGELIVGNAVAGESTIATFIADALDKEVQVVAADGGAVASGKAFKLLQKTATGYEFSDTINPAYVEKVTLKEYAPEIAKAVTISGFNTGGVVAAKRTYVVEIRVENELSTENFEVISGYYVTGEVLGADTPTTVVAGLVASLNANLKLRGDSEFTISSVAGTSITVTEQLQDNVPGKIAGRKLSFTAKGKVFDNVGNGYNSDLGLLTAAVVTAPSFGTGTGKWATNYEWFVKGYKYDADRATGYPADFTERTPFYASKSDIYNVINIKYYSPRTETSVERQYKVLTIIMAKPTNDNVGNVATNDVLTALGNFGLTVPTALNEVNPV